MALAAFLSVAPAHAQTDDAAEASRLFSEGRARMQEAGRLDEACLTLAKSYELRKRGDVLLNLAECHRRQGKTATAWREFDEAIRYAEEAEFAEAIEAAKTLRDALAKDLSELMVSVPSDPPPPEGLVILLDSKPLPSEQWGVRLFVDPGRHSVTATATGYEMFTGSADVKRGANRAVIEVKLDKLPEEPPPKVIPPPPKPPAAPPPEKGGVQAWGLIVGAAGLAMLGVSYGFGVYAVDRGGELDLFCGGEERLACRNRPEFGFDQESARSDELLGFGMFVGFGIAGIGATATGVVSLIADLTVESKPEVAIVPWMVPGGGGVGVASAIW